MSHCPSGDHLEVLNVLLHCPSGEHLEVPNVEEVSMKQNCHRTKSSFSVTLIYRCNSYVSQVSQKESLHFCDTWLT